jgi:hypothetical protein
MRKFKSSVPNPQLSMDALGMSSLFTGNFACAAFAPGNEGMRARYAWACEPSAGGFTCALIS